MGITKWIKSFVGIKKQGQNAEKLEKEHNAESSETVSHGIPLMFSHCFCWSWSYMLCIL
jgi:hypothetical protein